MRAYSRVLDAAEAVRIGLWDERGLTTVQLRAMLTVLGHGPMHTSELARRLHVRPATMTGIADRLVHRGFLERRSDPDDRRVITLALTEAGHEVLRDAETQLVEQMRSLLARCGDERAANFVYLLEELARMVGEFQPGEDSASPMARGGAAPETEVEA